MSTFGGFQIAVDDSFLDGRAGQRSRLHEGSSRLRTDIRRCRILGERQARPSSMRTTDGRDRVPPSTRARCWGDPSWRALVVRIEAGQDGAGIHAALMSFRATSGGRVYAARPSDPIPCHLHDGFEQFVTVAILAPATASGRGLGPLVGDEPSGWRWRGTAGRRRHLAAQSDRTCWSRSRLLAQACWMNASRCRRRVRGHQRQSV